MAFITNMKYSNSLQTLLHTSSNGGAKAMPIPLDKFSVKDCLRWLSDNPYDNFMLLYLKSQTFNSDDLEYLKELFDEKPLSGLLFLLNYHEKNALTLVDHSKFFVNNISWRVRSTILPEYNQVMESHNSWNNVWNNSMNYHITLNLLENPVSSFGDLSPFFFSTSITGFDSSSLSKQNRPYNQISTGIRDLPIKETKNKLDYLFGDGGLLHNVIIRSSEYDINGIYCFGIKWKIELKGNDGGIPYIFEMEQSSGGKALDRDSSFCSGYMETVERVCSCFGYFDLSEYRIPIVLDKSSHSHIASKYPNIQVLNPNDLNLPFPYKNHDLHWMRSKVVTREGESSAIVPAQLVFQYVNLDEVNISFWSSNGLAAGNTIDEARYQSLLEIIERDSIFQNFYSEDNVYILDSEDETIKKIIEEYKRKGVTVLVLDLTTDIGIPTYQTFIQIENMILLGQAAHLNGQIALVRALGELAPIVYNYEQDNSFVLKEKPHNFKNKLSFESLPNYSTGDVKSDLSILEKHLTGSGCSIYYTELIVKGVDIPVVRTIVPGLDWPEYGYSKRRELNYRRLVK